MHRFLPPRLFRRYAVLACTALLIKLSLPVASAWAAGSSLPPTAFDDESGEPEVLTHRTRPLKFRMEGSLLFAPTIAEKYTNHLGGMGAFTFHINDLFNVELMGGYLRMAEVDIIGGGAGVRASTPGAEPNLPDLSGMSWVVGANAAFAPIYGKLNLFSEVDFNSQIYLTGGVGVTGSVRKLRDPNSTDPTFTRTADAGAKFTFNVGFGFRVFLVRWIALRAEVRDFIFFDQYDFLGTGRKDVDVVHNFLGLVGVTFILN